MVILAWLSIRAHRVDPRSWRPLHGRCVGSAHGSPEADHLRPPPSGGLAPSKRLKKGANTRGADAGRPRQIEIHGHEPRGGTTWGIVPARSPERWRHDATVVRPAPVTAAQHPARPTPNMLRHSRQRLALKAQSPNDTNRRCVRAQWRIKRQVFPIGRRPPSHQARDTTFWVISLPVGSHRAEHNVLQSASCDQPLHRDQQSTNVATGAAGQPDGARAACR